MKAVAEPRPSVAHRPVVRAADLSTVAIDAVTVEEPLEIRVGGDPLAVTLRTPGRDQRLAVGFLIGEGLIRGIGDLATVVHCGRPGEEGYGNTIDCLPAPGLVLDPEAIGLSHRGTLTTASCGVCGRRTIDDLLRRLTPPADLTEPRLTASQVLSAVEALRLRQPTFDLTGGLHAAAAMGTRGEVLASEEDIGRHNAVDKVVGELAYRGLLGTAAMLVVSGRASFEMVQKAAAARVPVLVSVSAASSMAIDLARQAGITLVAFTRGDRFNVYSHPQRVAGAGPLEPAP